MKAFCTRVVGVPKRSQGINGLNVTYHDLRCVCGYKVSAISAPPKSCQLAVFRDLWCNQGCGWRKEHWFATSRGFVAMTLLLYYLLYCMSLCVCCSV